ncbi:hypothetical protein VTN00DRAFT_9260 [Thermoascus crustaceus]|uniref:uncharacterized protein n=1 Tax=Thermoascus crustaceus TaxID=5088 RepID=UPI0037430991
MFRRAVTVSFRASFRARRAYSSVPAAQNLKINGDRLCPMECPLSWWRNSPVADENDKMVNTTGTQFAKFDGEDDSIPPIAMGSHLDTVATGGRFDGPLGDIKTRAPLVLINWTNEEVARFPLLGSSIVYAG